MVNVSGSQRGVWDQESKGWDQESKGWDQGSEGWYLGSAARDQGSQAIRDRDKKFFLIREQAVPFLWDEGPKFVTLLQSRVRNLGTKMESAMRNHNSLQP